MSAPVIPCLLAVVGWSPPLGYIPIPASMSDDEHRASDIPALAVPDALWEDEGFGQAVYARVRDLVGFLATFEVLDAIHAELRARADGAA